MVRWMGIAGRIINLDYVRGFKIEKMSGELYNILALTDCDGFQWEVVATCTTEEQAFGYLTFLLKDDIVNAEGGHPSVRKCDHEGK